MVEEKDIEIQRSDEDGGRSDVDEAASAGQEGPLADDPAQRSVSNMFRGFFRVSTGSKLALKLYGSQKHKHMSHKRQALHSLVYCPLQLERLPSTNPLVNSQHGLSPTVLNPPPQSVGTEPCKHHTDSKQVR